MLAPYIAGYGGQKGKPYRSVGGTEADAGRDERLAGHRIWSFCRVDLGLSEEEIENLDIDRYDALAERVRERNKMEDFRAAKIQCAIFQAMCGKWENGNEITIDDFLPQEPIDQESAERESAKRLRMQFQMMADRDAKTERS